MRPEDLECNVACLRYLGRYLPKLASRTKFMLDKLCGWKIFIVPPLGKILPKGRKKVKMLKKDYQFKWTSEDQQVLIKLMDLLDEKIIPQPFMELLPVVMIVDISGWAIAFVLGQLE